jgi:hypothetical protein
MAFKIEQLNDRILRMMRTEDRKLFGKAGMTSEEAIRKAEIRSERDLQRQIENLLRLKGIEPIRSRMDKATSNNVGTPDFLFAITAKDFNFVQETEEHGEGRIDFEKTVACAWEVKLPGRNLESEQKTMQQAMTTHPNAWTHHVIHSVDDALFWLRSMGIE